MIQQDQETDTQHATAFAFDRIEVCGSIFTGPRRGTGLLANFQRPTEPLAFCLLGELRCGTAAGPDLATLADVARDVCGRDGFFGYSGCRPVKADLDVNDHA